MKILLVGINAKFIHSCLAVYYLKEYAKAYYDVDCEIAEFTINHREELILSEIFRKKPDIIAFSSYIWNFELVKSLVKNLKKLLPESKIILGGPEVSFDGEEVLKETGADFVICGEGEETFAKLCLAISEGEDVKRVVIAEKPVDMDKLPFVYKDFENFDNRILYYEAQRGCPFNCQYCLSSVNKGVRFKSLDKVKAELSVFLQNKVRQVKFVDRTFNANKNFALSIWKFLHKNDNGVTNFHFEMAADLITDDMIEFLKDVRPGLFQFEIGVQSTNEKTLFAIDRKSSFDMIKEKVLKLQKSGNIHLHLDLIAGLPFEDYKSFKKSFNDVYSLTPEQFQLGFLKLLKGSGLKRDAEKYGIVARDNAPYEVLFTDALSADDMLRLKGVEELVEIYYNSLRFKKSIEYAVSLAETPFDFYESFWEFYYENGEYLRPHSKVEQYDILYKFTSRYENCDAEKLKWLIKFDIYSHEKAKKIPEYITEDFNSEYRDRMLDFYINELENGTLLNEYKGLNPKQVYKMAHIEVFPFNPIDKSNKKTALLFNYRKTDISGNATVKEIQIF